MPLLELIIRAEDPFRPPCPCRRRSAGPRNPVVDRNSYSVVKFQDDPHSVVSVPRIGALDSRLPGFVVASPHRGPFSPRPKLHAFDPRSVETSPIQNG